MGLLSLIGSFGAAAIAFIFVVVFVYLASKWGIKRSKEISKRFDNELKEMHDKEKELKEIRKDIVDLKIQRKKLLKEKDVKKAKILDKEIEKREKKKKKLSDDINENY